jgi:hypothetical protein
MIKMRFLVRLFYKSVNVLLQERSKKLRRKNFHPLSCPAGESQAINQEQI